MLVAQVAQVLAQAQVLPVKTPGTKAKAIKVKVKAHKTLGINV